MKKNVNVSSSHKAGRKTQMMADQFSDLAGVANNKLMDKHQHAEQKKEVLTEVVELLESAIKKSEETPHSRTLQKLIKRIDKTIDDLNDYINEKV